MKHAIDAGEAMNRATVTFHTSPEIKARLDRLAGATRRSKSFLTSQAVERYLAEAEAGQLVAHEDAARYLRALGTDRPLARPTFPEA